MLSLTVFHMFLYEEHWLLHHKCLSDWMNYTNYFKGGLTHHWGKLVGDTLNSRTLAPSYCAIGHHYVIGHSPKNGIRWAALVRWLINRIFSSIHSASLPAITVCCCVFLGSSSQQFGHSNPNNNSMLRKAWSITPTARNYNLCSEDRNRIM